METHRVTENVTRCGKLEEKDVQNAGDTWIRVADPFHCAVETDTTLDSNCNPIKTIKK